MDRAPREGRQLLIGDVFRTGARSAPRRVAAVLGDRTLDYAAVDRGANRWGRQLAGCGVGHRDRVVLWSHTALEAVPLFAGVAKLGAVFAPANALLGVEEAAEMVGLARPAVLVVGTDRVADGEEVARRVGVPVLALDAVELDGAAGPGTDADVGCAELGEEDPHVLFFTSGSTGRSKGVLLSHRVNFLRSHPGSQLEPRGPTVCMYPLFHMGAWTIALQAWQAQSTLVLVPRADAELICDAVARWRATHLNAIPAVWRRILDHLEAPGGRDADLSSLRVVDSGTSATPPELLDAVARALPAATRRVFYGSTEAGAVTLLSDEDMARKPGSCGVPQHSCEIRLAPDSGELQVRGPLLFDGYFENSEATAAAFTPDGWYRTGDVAEVDDEGYVSIVGRVSDVIRTGGEAVAPAEVEAVLAEHPAVADVAVVGIPDAQWGEVVCAAVVPAAGRPAPTLDELLAHCEGRLARFKRPRRLAVVDSVPRTPATLQVKRRLLVEQLTSG